jgi:hypothetical protein
MKHRFYYNICGKRLRVKLRSWVSQTALRRHLDVGDRRRRPYGENGIIHAFNNFYPSPNIIKIFSRRLTLMVLVAAMADIRSTSRGVIHKP